MWPLHLLLNKFLKAEEEKDQGSDGCPLTEAEACPVGDLLSNKSIWTVDLAYLLQKFSVSFSYFTVTLGANPNFSVETFYKEQLPNDLVRVDMLFQKAMETGISIQCKSISKEEISLLILSGKYVAIALVDQYKLSRSWLEEVCVSGFNSGNSGYSGHYVVICGYDAMTDEFEIRDPASSREHEKITSNRLEEARKSFGTDEDLLLVSLQESQNQERQSIGYYLYRNFCLIVKDKTFWTLHERSRNLLVESPRMGQDWGWGL
ncbi:guanylyl cyclase 1 isoform X3 [Diospyros lotus]|uniref:guanylyl cyclase 1 isoform X3 n=1 Tax=Diospyros lotus TaxID=55363 RepID=UPI002259F00E|nr:guanylyl cyclase 1 isoform X3 [Diospyros lotus]